MQIVTVTSEDQTNSTFSPAGTPTISIAGMESAADLLDFSQ